MELEKRRIEIFTGISWVECKAENVKKGDKIRMFEPDGTPVEFGQIYLLVEDPSILEDGVASFKCAIIEV